MRRTELTKKSAKNKGYVALGSATVTALVAASITPWLAIFGVPLTLWLTYRWLAFRAKWGLRF